MATKVRIASVRDISPGTGVELATEGRVIALYHVDGEFFAMDGICPHAGGPLGHGQLEGCVVTCPWHGWQFDVTTGQHCLTKNIVHTRFPVEVQGDNIFVELP